MLKTKEFLEWAYGNIVNRTTREVFGEFLVHKALCSNASMRNPKDGFDISYRSSKIAVRTTGYLQLWKIPDAGYQARFDIRKKNPWLASQKKLLGRTCRYADIWIFSYHKEEDEDVADPLNEKQWNFYPTTNEWLDSNLGDQKSVRLSVLISNGLRETDYRDLRLEVDRLIESLSLRVEK